MSSDIRIESFIFKTAPASWHPYIKLMRIDRPIGIWLLLFPCWWAVTLASDGIEYMGAEQWILMGKMALGAILMRSAGCIVNDLWDRELDAQVERTKNRPLASGEMTQKQALMTLGVLLALSFVILLTLSRLSVILGFVSLALVAAYPKMKRITWWPQLFLGITFNWGALLGWAAVQGSIGLGSLLLYVGGIFWTLGYDTVYAHQDKQDDALVGIKSTARLFAEKSLKYVALFYLLSLFCFAFAKYHADPRLMTPMLIGVALSQIIWQLRVWDMNSPESCLRVFKSNQLYGWLILLMLAI